MASGGMKRGEKILFGIFLGIGVFALISFVLMEIIRARMDKPMYPTTTHYDFSDEGLRGSMLARKADCTRCHRIMRNGTNMALELDGIGSRRDFNYLFNFLKNPEATYPTKTFDHGPAPKEAAFVAQLPEADLHAIAVYLSELKADIGSPVARAPEGRSGFIDEMLRVWAPDSWKADYKDVRQDAQDEKGESK
jgi:cytochrome c553